MIAVRRARITDIPFIRRLTLETLEFGIPEERDISNKQVKINSLPFLQDLETFLHRKKDVAFLVAADDEKDDQPVGFLMLEFNHVEDSTGEPQTYVANLAVDPEYWGRYVVNLLVREAAKLSGQKGYKYMSSKISASNQRTVLQALRLGFQIERYQMTLACTPEGIVKMPGRPLSEKAHALSRSPEYRAKRVKKTRKTEAGEST